MFGIIVLVILCPILLWLGLKPLNLQRDLWDVGVNHLMSVTKNRSKKKLAKEVQRLRMVGKLPPVYPNGWFALLESDNLKKSQVKHVTALGENFAVFRDEEGNAHILDAYCPHLGANMAIGGIVRGNCLECPFHSWQFDGRTGACTSIPYSRRTPDFVKVKKWTSLEINSFIYVWYHAENEEPSWYPESIEFVDSWMYQGRSEFLVGCHIQEIPENGADVAHLNAIHRPSLLAGQDLRHDAVMSKLMKHVWSAEWKQSEEESHKGLLSLTLETVIFDKVSLGKMNVNVQQIGPGYVVMEMKTIFGPMLLLQVVTPVEPLLQRVVHRMYSPWQQSVFAKFVLYAELIMFERDILVWNYKKYVHNPVLVKEDQTVLRYRRWYSKFYSENSPTLRSSNKSLLW